MGNHRVGVGLQFATAPTSSGTRSGYGWEIGPRCRGSEIARQCGAVVRQERSSGKPGGLFLVCSSCVLFVFVRLVRNCEPEADDPVRRHISVSPTLTIAGCPPWRA